MTLEVKTSKPVVMQTLLPQTQMASPKEFFLNLESVLKTALMSKDMNLLESLLDDRFRAVGMTALVHSKEQMITEVRERASYRHMEIVDISVIEEDGFAVVMTDWNLNVTYQRIHFDGLLRVSKVWIKRPKGWKILSYQVADARKSEAWREALAAVAKPNRDQ